MPLTGQPTFEPRDIPTVTEMTTWMATITAKFNAALNADDLEWPLVAGGHLDLDGNELLGLAKNSTRYNIQARRPWQTAQMVFDEVEARGGGAVFLPPNSTLKAQTDPQGKSGVKIGNNTVFHGGGHTSVCQKLYLAGKSNIIIEDMQIDGFSNLLNCQNITFIRCNFTATTGNNIMQIEDCEDIVFDDCFFVDTATAGILAYNVPGLVINNCGFKILDPVLIRMSTKGRPHSITGCYFSEPDATVEYTLDVIGIEPTQFKYNNLTFPVTVFNVNSFISENVLMDGGKVHYSGTIGGHLSSNLFESVANDEYTIKIINSAVASAGGVTFSWLDSGATLYGNVIMDNNDIAVYIYQSNSVSVVANVIYSTDEALVLTPDYRTAPHQTYHPNRNQDAYYYLINGNSLYSEDAALPAMGIWGLVGDTSTDYWQTVIMGNTLDSALPHGLGVFRDAGSTAGGIIGNDVNYDYFFVIAGNMTPATTLDGGAANSDIDHDPDSYTVALDVDNTAAINNT